MLLLILQPLVMASTYTHQMPSSSPNVFGVHFVCKRLLLFLTALSVNDGASMLVCVCFSVICRHLNCLQRQHEEDPPPPSPPNPPSPAQDRLAPPHFSCTDETIRDFCVQHFCTFGKIDHCYTESKWTYG